MLILAIWVIYDYIQTKTFGLSLFVLVTQNLVLIAIQYYLKWNLEKMKNRIRELRKKLGVRQEDVAKTVGVTKQTINAIENEKYTPTLEFAIRLAKLLNTTVEELFILDDVTSLSRKCKVDFSPFRYEKCTVNMVNNIA